MGVLFAHDNTTSPVETKLLTLFSCKRRTAVFAGAGAGIHLSVAQLLAVAGENVAIWYKSENPLNRADQTGKGVQLEM